MMIFDIMYTDNYAYKFKYYRMVIYTCTKLIIKNKMYYINSEILYQIMVKYMKILNTFLKK
jgi:hypothetical protein